MGNESHKNGSENDILIISELDNLNKHMMRCSSMN